MADAKVTVTVGGKDARVVVTEHKRNEHMPNSIGDPKEVTYVEAGEKVIVKLGDDVGTVVIKEA